MFKPHCNPGDMNKELLAFIFFLWEVFKIVVTDNYT